MLDTITSTNKLMLKTLINSKIFINTIGYQGVKFNEMYNIPINDQISIASTFTYYTNHPTYFMPEILNNE